MGKYTDWLRFSGRVLVIVVLTAVSAHAQSAMGGFLHMRSAGSVPGQYVLRLEVLLDAAGPGIPRAPHSQSIVAIRRRDNQVLPIGPFQLVEVSREAMQYRNTACQTSYKLSTIRLVYQKEITLNPADFSDTGGYYLVWSQCCRPAKLTNIDRVTTTGSAFRVELNPALDTGLPLANSTPLFRIDRLDAICLKQDFSMNMGATDADGDELRYSLVSPLQASGANAPGINPVVRWKAGYSATTAIPGTPALRIDPATGTISVKASEVGFFAFAVLCEEYRNGQRIGSTLCDASIGVYDCNAISQLPKPILTADGQTGPPFRLCPAVTSLTLRTTAGPYRYEWRRNEADLPAETGQTLGVDKAGDYTVTVYNTTTCAAPATSDPVPVTLTAMSQLSVTAPGPTTICAGQTSLLTAFVPADVTGNWFWRKDGQRVGNNRQTTLTVSESGTYTLTGDWETNACVVPPIPVHVQVASVPATTIVASAPRICQGETYQLTASPADLASQYAWFDAGGSVVGSGVSITRSQASSYRLLITTPDQCTAAVTSPAGLVMVQPVQPVIIQAGGSTTFCEGSSVRLTWPGVGLSNAVWTRDGTDLTTPVNSTALLADQPGVYSLRGDLAACAQPPNSLTIQVAHAPVAGITLSTATICQGDTYSLQATPETPGQQYRWLGPDGRMAGYSAQISTTLTGPFTLTTTSPGLCNFTLTAPLVGAVPLTLPDITPKGPLSICAGSSLVLTVELGTLSGLTWSRDGIPMPGTQDVASLTVTQAGRYTVQGDVPACTRLPAAVTVTVNALPAATISASQSSVCAGDAYWLSATPVEAGNRYQWLTAGGAVASMASSFISTQPGPFLLRVTTAAQCTLVASGENLVRFDPLTDLRISPVGPVRICEGTSVQLTVTGGNVSAYRWSRNGVDLANTDGQSQYTVTESGTYALSGDFPSCTRLRNQPAVTVTPIPVTTLVASQSLVCMGDAFQLRPTLPVSGYQYQWTNAAGAAVGSTAILSTTQPGVYALRVSSPTPCTFAASSQGLVDFMPTTLLRITPAGPVTFCAGQSAQLTSMVGPLTGYSWTRNGTVLPNSLDSPAVVVQQSGTYALTGTFPICTRLQNPVQVQVQPLPVVQIVPSSLTLCQNDVAQITAQTDASNTLRWLQNGVAAGTARSLTTTTGATYSLTATTPVGCTQTVAYTFAPQIFALPSFILTAAPAIWQNAGIQAGNAPENPAYRYLWTPPDRVSDPTVARPVFNPFESTLYTLTITDLLGCRYADTLRITIWPRVFTPTAFTPNGDGDNDNWQPVNLDKYPNAELDIYDRWGTLVYSGKPGQPPFDGKLLGAPLPEGIYAYRIRLNFRSTEWAGTLTLLR